ncbi:hypothetical protein Leryth_019433 [Lithospermum erythrorhizon]|nr:hypothetical protein Leryth_019433 [Lithospermum erythrorhizon]
MEDSWLHMNKHIVLVHGTGHGAWCWYKQAFLRLGVTAVSFPSSDMTRNRFRRYTHSTTTPYHCSTDERYNTFGHSLGGMNIALAMEKYPHKVSIDILCVSAFIDTTFHAPSMLGLGDTKFFSVGSLGREPLAVMSFGPKALENALYQLCPPEDLVLAKMLVRPGSLFLEDLSMANKFSKEGFGSVKRVYVIDNKDRAIPEEFQRWLVANMGVIDFKEIKEADHMSMLSRPQELCKCLLDFNRI